MRRLLRWIAGLVSVAALAKLLSGRRRHADPVEADLAEPDPAEELRRKLDEVRSAPRAGAEAATASAPPAAAGDAGDETDDAPTEAPTSIEERRAAIHARAQEAIDAMKEIAP